MARPRVYNDRRQTSIRLPADLLEAIDETADEWVMGRNLLIERLLRMALDRMDPGVDPLTRGGCLRPSPAARPSDGDPTS